MNERYALGVDVGGTFTDIALIRIADGAGLYHKLPSTPDDPSRAIGTGVQELLSREHIAPGAVAFFGHGTTVATNALITGRLARTAMITTAGFRDILEIRRQRQPHNYDIRMPKPPPLVPRQLRLELRERTYLYGRDNTVPDLAALDSIISGLARAGIEAIAICFLHSYHNPAHEQLVAAAIRERYPEMFTCASHEVLAEFREFERMTSTAINASLGPVMQRYLTRLEERASGIGLPVPHILQSNGGVASPRDAAATPVRTLVSGPAAGVTGAVHIAGKSGFPDIITFDVGGTSTDVCLIEGGQPLIARERLFNGHPIRFPMIDVHSVGAGGGSIGWVDGGSFLHVGPQSAGANPGPACYDLGGREPTVTDANVVLGRLPSDALLDGRLPIKAELAAQAINDRIARPMGLSIENAAVGLLTILNENMVQAIRVISVEQGFDPRRFALVAFGGAGPLLASSLACELGISRVLIPPHPGLLCALGLLMADARSDFSLTRIASLAACGSDGLNQGFSQLERQASVWFERERIDPANRILRRGIDMRYIGQSHEITVPVQAETFYEADVKTVAATFRREHERLYGYAPEAPQQVVTFRVTAYAKTTAPLGTGPALPDRGEVGMTGQRRVYFREYGDFTDCPVYDRARLMRGSQIKGPAVINQLDTTTIILPDQTAEIDEIGCLLLTFT
jgi:N-methylhydantoinase A